MEKSRFYADARNDGAGPLDGVRVLEATTSWAGPMCGCLLADLGADVVKVEIPDGEMMRKLPPFLPGTDPPVGWGQATVNRNKRSVTLDLRLLEGRELFVKLTRRADIIIENFRPGTFDDWGIGYDAIKAVKPDIIYVSISGYGQFGPLSDRVGYDPFAQAQGGFISLNGSPEGPMVKAPTFLCDDLAGLHATIGALAALRHRDRTGEGQHVDSSLLDAVIFQSIGLPTLGAMGVPLARMGNEFPFAVPLSVYQCRDGAVMAGVVLDTQWQRLARLIGHPELAEHPGFATLIARAEHRSQCNAFLADWLAERTRAEAIESFAREQLPIAPVQSYAEAARDPHVLARDMMQPVEQEDGTVAPIVGPAVKLSRTPLRVRTASARLGEHTEVVLGELGVGPDEREQLRKRRVI